MVNRLCLRPNLILILRPFFLCGDPFLAGEPFFLGGAFFAPLREGFLAAREAGLFFGLGGGGAFLAFGGGGGGAFLAFGGGGGAFLAFGGGGGGAFLPPGGGGGGGGGGLFAMANTPCKHRAPLKKSGRCWVSHAGNSSRACTSRGESAFLAPRPDSSITNSDPTTSAPCAAQSSAQAPTVPPVARRSSTITTF